MLGVRIARAYPNRVGHLLCWLAKPIGLEDYRPLCTTADANRKILERDPAHAEVFTSSSSDNYSLKPAA